MKGKKTRFLAFECKIERDITDDAARPIIRLFMLCRRVLHLCMKYLDMVGQAASVKSPLYVILVLGGTLDYPGGSI